MTTTGLRICCKTGDLLIAHMLVILKVINRAVECVILDILSAYVLLILKVINRAVPLVILGILSAHVRPILNVANYAVECVMSFHRVFQALKFNSWFLEKKILYIFFVP